ncbi:MAG: bifunctional metallophosphatase/5'-nucleotidase [Myxococcaceae bacterium]|nr:bifunctional metallophosphatase/5'-nucleotidase [Myxococcaceae bacterium]
MPLAPGDDTDLSGQEVRLTILHTSDIHSRIEPYYFNPLKTDVDLGLIPDAAPFGGAARIAAILKRERANADRVIHLDSGDCFQGAPIFNLNTGEVEFKFLSRVDLDAAVIGNHEFDAGAANFTRRARDFATFPLLAANYIWEAPATDGSTNGTGLYTAPYSIHNIKGVRVGVIGMANISSLNSIVEGGNSLQATPLEQNEAARAYVDLLRPSVDLVIIVSHLGLTEDQDLIQGYEAYYRYGDIRPLLERSHDRWEVLEWFGPKDDPQSVVRVKIPGVSGIDVVLGGHLHVVLNPPQTLIDPSGRKVILSHSGAFAKYVGRLDLVIRMPTTRGQAEGAEVLSHTYRVFPVDSVWCDDAIHQYYRDNFFNPGDFAKDPKVVAAVERCKQLEDAETIRLLEPYEEEMAIALPLSNIFAFAPRDIARRNNSTGGDSPLGNLTADSMRLRKRVEAEVALTNSLGIRDNLYSGPITNESMFNVFPFENTINIMYLSGLEMQELFDFVTERSAGRGCQSQAQISGARFTMDCAQAQLNDLRYPCDVNKTGADNGSDCPQTNREGRNLWQCIPDETGTGGRCWAHPALDVQIRGKPIDPASTYKIAVNDYIAKGGSGFNVLKRNTSRIETGISLRDSLIDYMQDFCTCEDICPGLDDKGQCLPGKLQSSRGVPCGTVTQDEHGDDHVTYDEQVLAYCKSLIPFQKQIDRVVGNCNGLALTCRDALAHEHTECGEPDSKLIAQCSEFRGPTWGTCTCADVLMGNTQACSSITPPLRNFCEAPRKMPIAIGSEDGRIGRRVK